MEVAPPLTNKIIDRALSPYLSLAATSSDLLLLSLVFAPAQTANGGGYRRPEAPSSLSSAHFLFATSSSLSLSLPCPTLCSGDCPS
ncbi:hypothetical protein YC2023_077262 [Brassica napus]